MIRNDPTYNRFMRALQHVVEKDWHRKKSVLALESGISGGYLSEVLNGNKRASFDKQNAIVKACGYTYDDFLALGESLLAGEDPGSLKKSSDANLTKEVSSKEVKVGKKMEVEELRELLQHYKEELSELREEIRYLRGELKEARQETETKDKPSKPEKKTAV
ncbi:hypothetical protein [Desulfoluna butyratoxydans]|uniref:Lambda repressor-like dna-binding domain n=1 Tax=Desulfoluna butyratoxydans TaxID=231438 RepID=A0A4U8YIQ6_9BACT|nr:hypothetical protein [Desulfoluna butyratoxydans]VFQ43481.1 lambda repressor-like dna-binding domain [Desulfoluna butyratoxydans]